MSDEFFTALMLRLRCNLEELVTKREAMIAANQTAWATWNNAPSASVPYKESDFKHLADRIADIAPDPHQFQ